MFDDDPTSINTILFNFFFNFQNLKIRKPNILSLKAGVNLSNMLDEMLDGCLMNVGCTKDPFSREHPTYFVQQFVFIHSHTFSIFE